MAEIFNTFRTYPSSRLFYEVSEPVYQNGDYAVYKLPESYLYAYKGVAIAEKVGIFTKLVDALATKTPLNGILLLSYERCLDNQEKGLKLKEQITTYK